MIWILLCLDSSHRLCFQGSLALWHAPVLHSRLWLNSQSSDTPHSVYPLSVGGHFGCSRFLIITNNIAINIGIPVSVYTCISNSMGHISRSRIPGSYSSSMCKFLSYPGDILMGFGPAVWPYWFIQ